MKKNLIRITVFCVLLAVLLPCVFAGTEMLAAFFPKNASITLSDAAIDGEYVKNVPIGTTAGELLNRFPNGKCVTKFHDYDIASGSRVGTGYKLITTDNVEYTILVEGDLDGDTYVTGKDLVRAKKHLIAGNNFYYESVLDFNRDGSFTQADLSGFSELIMADEPEFNIYDRESTDLGDDFYATIELSYTDNVITANIGHNIVASDKTMSANQIWHFVRYDDGTYVISSVGMGTTMEVSYADPDQGTNVSLYNLRASDNQKWYLVECDGGYIFRSKCADDRVIDVYSASTENDANIHMYGINYSDAQIFYINKVEDIDVNSNEYFEQVGPLTQSAFYANLVFGKSCLSVDENDNVCVKSTRQYWRFEPQTDGTYKIISAVNDEVLDVYSANMENSTNIQTYQSNDTAAQRWYIYMKNGKAVLRSALDQSFVVDVYSGSDAEDTNVHLYTYNASNAQHFTFEDYTLKLPAYSVTDPYNTIIYGRYETLAEAKANVKVYLGQVVHQGRTLVYNPCPSFMAAKLVYNAKRVSDFAAANAFAYAHADYNPGYNWQYLDINRPVASTERWSSCDRLVDWALWISGVTDKQGNKISHGPVVYEQVNWIPSLGYQKITNPAALKPGDIVFTSPDPTKPGLPGHIFICASENMGGNLYLRYDHGSTARIRYVNGTEYLNGKAPFLERIGTADQPKFYYAYRPID